MAVLGVGWTKREMHERVAALHSINLEETPRRPVSATSERMLWEFAEAALPARPPAIFLTDDGNPSGPQLFRLSWHSERARLSVLFRDDGTMQMVSSPLPSTASATP